MARGDNDFSKKATFPSPVTTEHEPRDRPWRLSFDFPRVWLGSLSKPNFRSSISISSSVNMNIQILVLVLV